MSASSSSIAGTGQRSIHAWLLLLPALVLLLTFTHWPAVATFIDSFYSTPKGARAAVWVGIDNYQTMVEDPVFWQSVRNNLWFAAATIPASIGLALLMAVWVNERIAGRTFVRMAYFTPTVLPMIAVAVFLHAAIRFAGAGNDRLGPAIAQLAGQPFYRAGGGHVGSSVERGRLLHDLLPGSFANAQPQFERSGRH